MANQAGPNRRRRRRRYSRWQVEAAAAQVEGTLGPIDIWVNVAFTSVFTPFTEIRPEEIERVTEVSYLGYVYGTGVALDRMLPRDHGTIVQVGSTLAYRGIPLQTAYCGAKHAIQGFTEALRCELLHHRPRPARQPLGAGRWRGGRGFGARLLRRRSGQPQPSGLGRATSWPGGGRR
jgi:NAD(P)-dependent dehydrogenase (short-subunit alcohol dehydrogenase family)